MTTPAEVPAELIASLRELAQLDGGADTGPWSDERIANALIATMNPDGSYNLDAAAGYVWRVKAAEYSELVDTQESGSVRKLSDLHKNALAMAGRYESKLLVGVETRGRTRIRDIRRA